MIRAAVYARFSTELQDERSIEDQVTLCREYSAREGLDVVTTFSDHARSGASVYGREGLLSLMKKAKNGDFDVVVVEALDRLSRDMEDLAGIHKRLSFAGIEIRAVHEGVVNTVLVGLRGLIGQLYREDNAHKIRRGLMGRTRQGLSAGGSHYGYRADPNEKGKLVIVEEEAEVIRRIFHEFIAGRSPRSIAHDLNRDRIAPPRGRAWNASTINGSRKRGTGIIRNGIYAGKPSWNKVRMVKNPDTGRRISRPNPADQWQVSDVPELAIVTLDDFAAAQARKRSGDGKRPEAHRQPRRLLSGLLRCGCCGAGMSTNGRDRTGECEFAARPQPRAARALMRRPSIWRR